MLKNLVSFSTIFLVSISIYICIACEGKKVNSINCVGVEKLDQSILTTVINPFSKEEKSLAESSEGGEALCRLIDYLNQQLLKQDPKESKEIIALNLRKLSLNRNQILKKKILPENVAKVDQIAKEYVGNYQSSDQVDVVLQIFLLPTCSKCGKFVQNQIKTLIEDWEKHNEKLGLKIILHPYVSKHLLDTPASKVDDEMSAYWQQLNHDQVKISIDQWYEWYNLVVGHSEIEFLKDPMSFFRKIIKVDFTQDDAQKAKWNAKTQELIQSLLLKDNDAAPVILINHQMWHNYKAYPVTYEHVIDVIKNQNLFDQYK